MKKPDSEEALERSIDRLLRDQPPRRAPARLAQRVLAEIERREARPWWQKGFYAWPVAARVAFCLMCFGAVAIALEIPAWLANALSSNLPSSFSRGIALWQVMMTVGASITHTVPMHWVYAAICLIALLYAAFFGAGVAAYRTLFENR